MNWCDRHPDVLTWASEELPIRYYNPVTKKYHRYFPDFIIRKRSRDGSIITVIIEIKPKSQARPPVARKKTKKYINEVLRYEINKSKWQAAQAFCKERGFYFQVLTEDELNIK